MISWLGSKITFILGFQPVPVFMYFNKPNYVTFRKIRRKGNNYHTAYLLTFKNILWLEEVLRFEIVVDLKRPAYTYVTFRTTKEQLFLLILEASANEMFDGNLTCLTFAL